MRRRLTTRHILAAGATLAVTAAILPPASAAIDPLGSGGASAATLDSRDTDSALPPTPGQLDATRALVAAAPDGARVTWDERFGTPRSRRRHRRLPHRRPQRLSRRRRALLGVRQPRGVRPVGGPGRRPCGQPRPRAARHRNPRRDVHPGVRRGRGGAGRATEHRGHRGRQGPLVRRQPDPRGHGHRVVLARRGRCPGRGGDRARRRDRVHAGGHWREGRLHDVREGSVRRAVLRAEGSVPDTGRRGRGVPRAVRREDGQGVGDRRRRAHRRRPLQDQPGAARVRGHRLRELPRRHRQGWVAGRQVVRPDRRVARWLGRPDRGRRPARSDDAGQQRQHLRQLLELHRPRSTRCRGR